MAAEVRKACIEEGLKQDDEVECALERLPTWRFICLKSCSRQQTYSLQLQNRRPGSTPIGSSWRNKRRGTHDRRESRPPRKRF